MEIIFCKKYNTVRTMVFISDSSGRFGTSYIPVCTLNSEIKTKAGIKDNYSYRLYLQRNAEELMKAERQRFADNALKCDCEKCDNASQGKFN